MPPKRMLDLPRDIGMDERSVPPFEPMLERYYELRGWWWPQDRA